MADRLAAHARVNRNNPTEPELRLWRALSGSKMGGFKFRRQHRLGNRIVDFFCPAINLAVEIDGHTHDARLDALLDAALEQRGIATVRFSNTDVMTNIEGVVATLLRCANARPARWSCGPHPNPSPKGEGLRE